MNPAVRELRALIETLDPSLSLRAFLQATGHLDLEPAERLRILAIEQADDASFERLRQIFEKGISLDPDHAWLHASFGICASRAATVSPSDTKASRLHSLAHAELDAAARLSPDDAEIATARGQARYADPNRPPEHVLEELDRALSLAPSQPWASLYRAHALHDLERWSEAVDAYDRVPANAFDGPTSWRIHLLVEQRGYCRLRAGDVEGAKVDLEAILGRYEAQPHLAQYGDLVYLRLACEYGMTELSARVEALTGRV